MANLKGIIDSIRKIMWQDTGLDGDAQRIEQLGRETCTHGSVGS
ncbi:MAG: hypothetical protein ACXIT9_11000 [Nitritalea sp.]